MSDSDSSDDIPLAQLASSKPKVVPKKAAKPPVEKRKVVEADSDDEEPVRRLDGQGCGDRGGLRRRGRGAGHGGSALGRAAAHQGGGRRRDGEARGAERAHALGGVGGGRVLDFYLSWAAQEGVTISCQGPGGSAASCKALASGDPRHACCLAIRATSELKNTS